MYNIYLYIIHRQQVDALSGSLNIGQSVDAYGS